jgi:hypothetical protein
MASSGYIHYKTNCLIFLVLQLAMTLSLEDESTGLLPGSRAATQSLEGPPAAAACCPCCPVAPTSSIVCQGRIAQDTPGRRGGGGGLEQGTESRVNLVKALKGGKAAAMKNSFTLGGPKSGPRT